MTVHALQSDFSRGALTPLLYGRHDKKGEFFGKAIAESKNFLILKYGILRRRSGTRFLGETKFANRVAVFRPFKFSATQAFFLEIGHQYIRFWTTDGEQILSGPNPYEVVTTYVEADVPRIQIAQSGDTIFFAHPNYPPKKLQRITNTNWSFSDVDFVDGPWLPLNDTTVTCDPASNPTVGGSQVLTFSSASAINGGAGFTNADIGRYIRVQCTTWCWFKITAVTNTTTVTATSQSAGATNAATTAWRLSAFGAYEGYPGSVEFFKGRLVWSRTNQRPRAHWLSMSQFPFKHEPTQPDGTVTDEHGFMVESLAANADEVLWLRETRSALQIGTASSIRTISSNSNGDVFGPRAYDEDLGVSGGTIAVVPVSAGASTVHPGRFGLSLNDLYYDFQANGLVAPDVSALSEHLLRSGVKEMAYQQTPSGMIYALTNEGKLVVTTYERYEKIIGLHAHETREGDEIESICSAPDYVNKRDALIMIVKRRINEQTVRYAEMLEPEFHNKDIEDAWFLDCAARYEGAPTNGVTGLDHLAGEIVSIFADGANLPTVQVSQDGEIDLPNGIEASRILVGLPMTARAKVLRASHDNNNGSQLGLEKRSPYVVLDVFETSGVKVAPVSTGIFEIVDFRSTNVPMNTATPLYTGTTKKTIDDQREQAEIDGQIEILCDLPLPATVRALNVGYEP